MRTSTVLPSLVALLAAAPSALASLATLRGTIPGSLHQCEATNVFFFDSAAARPLTLVLLPAAVAPAAATVTLAEVLALGPLQVIEGITTPDAQQTNFILAIAEGEAFVSYGFLPDGTGKNLNLPRSVQAPLPGAAACNPATAASAQAAVAAAAAPAPETIVTTTRRARTTTAAAVSTPAVAAAVSSAPAAAASVASSAVSGASSAASSAGSAASAAAASKGATSDAVSRVASGVAGVLVGGVVAVAAFAL
ncbi:hypothetical protein JCM10450v2_008142 [Rhodotorula kratochvilovae]